MSYRRDPWTQFRYKLEQFERSIEGLVYAGAFDPPVESNAWAFHDLPAASVTPDQIASILSEGAVASPHGLKLLEPLNAPQLPSSPDYPSGERPQWSDYLVQRAEKARLKRDKLKADFEAKFAAEVAQLKDLREGCAKSNPQAICALVKISLIRHCIARPLLGAFDAILDPAARIILCSVEIPDFARLSIVRKRGTSWKAKWQPVSTVERRRLLETVLYALCLRAAYLTAMSDVGDWFDTIAINGFQSWHDPATGKPRDGVIASLQVPKAEILQLQVSQLEAKACFRHLKGITTPSVEQVAPIRPIFVMNTNDGRIIENRDVADQLDRQANLAAMPWEDFEQLVRQLFEWEFGRNGVEVKVTRASRDRGVDAIMFDPDPLRGGKYVLQAKRYTRPVDVAAVRDLYGTVVNEGANRGIIVTTSVYGPDAYDFAKDKPLSLVDGPNLIAMLKRHGRSFRIDLAEARRLEAAKTS
jgi:restriction system protein